MVMLTAALRVKGGTVCCVTRHVGAAAVAMTMGVKVWLVTGRPATPLIPASASETLLETAATVPALLPIGGATHEVVLSDAANSIETATIEMPAIEPPIAGFATGEVKKMDLWVRENGELLPHQFGWMQPQLALHI